MKPILLRAATMFHRYDCDECRQHNARLSAEVLSIVAQGEGVQSHYFAGRYENIYIAASRLPLLSIILHHARQHAATILQQPVTQLQLGHWFNIMRQGEVTLPHTHDDDDELLSGVYYLQVPAQAGELVLTAGKERQIIEPCAGMFVFFSPQLHHEVTPHPHATPRISLGFNVGLRRTDEHRDR